MKRFNKIFSIILILLFSIVSAHGQSGTISVKKLDIKLAGHWKLTSFRNPDQFCDTWEFNKDGSFIYWNIHRNKRKGVIPTEGIGVWEMKNDTLNIRLEADRKEGKVTKYDSSLLWQFLIVPIENGYQITLVNDNYPPPRHGAVLILAKFD